MLKARYTRSQPVIKDPDRKCIICKKKYKAVSPMQKTCSQECRRKKNQKSLARFKVKHPDKQKRYNETRLKKNPNVWREKAHSERADIIKKLGGKCCVRSCKVRNPLHLHIDYVPTMIGTGFRHPRHKRWVLDNLKDFRLMCANHHYELTITGKIVGSKITQRRRQNMAV